MTGPLRRSHFRLSPDFNPGSIRGDKFVIMLRPVKEIILWYVYRAHNCHTAKKIKYHAMLGIGCNGKYVPAIILKY